MALIICKGCGGRVSTRATVCPKCGCPVGESLGGQPEETLRDSATGNESTSNTTSVSKAKPSARPSVAPMLPDDNKPKRSPWAVVAIVLVIIAAAGVGYFAYDKHQKALAEEAAIAEQHRQDSIAEVKALAELAEAARQDSLKKVNFSTPDLSLFDLHGDVKTVNCSPFANLGVRCEEVMLCNEAKHSFTEDGTLSNAKQSLLGERIKRDSEGRIIESESGDPDGAAYQYNAESFKWRDGKVYETHTRYGTYNHIYDSNGLVKEETFSEGGFGGFSEGKTVYSNYVVDEVGNWVERKYVTKGTINTFEEKPFSYSAVQRRTLTYYTQRESKRYTIDEYLATKKQ